MRTFLLFSDVLNVKPRSLIVFQRAHVPPLKLIFFLSAGDNDCKVGRSPSVVVNFVNRSSNYTLVKIISITFNFPSWQFFLWRVPNFFPTRLLCSHSFKMRFRLLKDTPVSSFRNAILYLINVDHLAALSFFLHKTVNINHQFLYSDCVLLYVPLFSLNLCSRLAFCSCWIETTEKITGLIINGEMLLK
jgi:hypothetical protein